MNRTHRIVPTYTGDVSGACSALFELGGMVVIHDPSGCNSTYNTHDETRWYDHDSLIFITGLVERDAVLGNDNKLVRDVVDAAGELHPRFVALCNSPIPFISGTDFVALARLIERRAGVPCFYVPTNGMHDYVVGAGNALAAVAERFVDARPRRAGSVNILGATPLDLGVAGSHESLASFARDAGFATISCWAMGSDLDDLSRAAEAEANLVVSACGLPVARDLWRRFGTPYVVGFPMGGFADVLADALRTAARTGTCAWPSRDARAARRDALCVAVGEPVVMGSYAAAAELAGQEPMRVVCPLEACDEALGKGDVVVCGEEEVEAALAGASLVVADQLYAPICPSTSTLVALPHQALSGRNGWRDARDLTTLAF